MVQITKHLGCKIERSRGSDGKAYLSAVIWFPRSARRLGYFYPSIRWL